MDLAAHQRQMLALLKYPDTPIGAGDPYVDRVARSKELHQARKNIFLWRLYVLERTAILSCRLLQRLDRLGATLQTFIALANISPFRETQAPAFLALLSEDNDHLVASVARFELAYLKFKEGDPARQIIPWRVEPTAILNRLAKDEPLDEFEVGHYQVIVSGDLPGGFEVTRRQQPG